jgi:hypothetical protein
MSRNIKSLIVGLSDSPVIKEEWNITPVTTTTTPDLAIVSSHNCNVVSGEVIADVTGVTDGSYLSVVKTNITMQGLETDKTIKFGFEATDVPSLSPCIIGIYIAPGNMSASAVANEVNSIFFLGQPLSNNRIIHYSLLFNSTYQAPTTFRVPNAATASGIIGNFSNIAANRSDLAVGSKSGMLLSRRNNNLYIGRFDVKSDGSTYDLNGREAVVNGPVFDNTLTVFFFTLSADMGNGVQNIAYIPSVTLNSPAYDVTGTSASLTPPPNNVDWANFINPVRPSFSQVNQATLPVDARVDQLYRVVIDPSYTGPDPAPYGYPLKNNQTILINNISGSGAITALVDNETLIELTNDILSPVVAQQATMLQSITDIGNLLQQTQDDVNVALLNAPEVVVYVKPENIISSPSDTDFSTSVSFNTFHAAYGYLLTLPKFIKKRIVLDDRDGGLVTGDATTVYNLMENNIIISTYRAYTGQYVDMLIPAPVFGLNLDCTGLAVDKFVGQFNCLSTNIVGGSWDVNDLPVKHNLEARLVIGDDSYMSISDNAIDLVTDTNYIKIGNNSYLFFQIFSDIITTGVKQLIISRGRDTRIDLHQSTLLTPHPTIYPFVTIFKPHDNAYESLQIDSESIYHGYTDNSPFQSEQQGYSPYTIVESISNLGTRDGLGNFNLTNNKYLFVKSIFLGSGSLTIPVGTEVILESLPTVKLLNDGSKPVIANNGKCIDNIAILEQSGVTPNIPILQNRGRYYRRGGRLVGNMLLSSSIDNLSGEFCILHMSDFDHFPNPAYSGITTPSLIEGCHDVKITNMSIKGLTPNIPIFNFNLPTIDQIYNYVIDGVYLTRSGVPTNGVIDITNAYSKSHVNLAEIITIKNVKQKLGGLVKEGPLVTKDGSGYPYRQDPVFDFDNRRLGLLLYNGTGSGQGNGTNTSPVLIVGTTDEGSGFKRDTTFLEFFKYLSRQHGKRFLVTLRADIYRTAASGDAFVSVKQSDSTLSTSSGDTYLFTLPGVNTRVPIEIMVPVQPSFGDYISVHAGLNGSTGTLFMEKIRLLIQEL